MQVLLIILFFLPFLYKSLFWLYTLQLKEYRWDRFKEYMFTAQGKSAFLNFWFTIEFPILLFTFMIFTEYNLEGVVFKMLFYLFILENIFVLGKIFRRKILIPKFTGRALLMFLAIFLLVSIIIYFMFYNILFYTTIILILLFPYVLFFLINLLLLPLITYKKNTLIKKAKIKSKEVKNPIKIAITGSFGKTSVKEFLSSILKQDGKTLKTPKNINSELGVSDLIIKKLDDTYKYFVAEIGAYRIGEIKTLGKIVNHKYGFLTAIGNQHLGLFGSIENTKKAKTEIIKKILKNKGILYANFDNKNIKDIYFSKKLNLVKYGIDTKKLDAKSEIIKVKNGKTSFNFSYKGLTTKFTTTLIGKHNIVNITGVLACALDLGINIKNLKQYLKNVVSSNNTLKIIEIDGSTIIDDSYNLSEDGLFAGIDVLSTFVGNKILVLDDILELGKKAKKIHFKVGKKIAESKKIDKILYAGINYQKDFLYGLADGGFSFDNIITDLENIKKGDIILLEGKGSKKYFN